MAAFPYQDLPFLVDYVLAPDVMMELSSSSTSPSPSLSPPLCFPEDQCHLLDCTSKSTNNYSEPIFYGEQSSFGTGSLVNFHQDQLNPIDCSGHESSCVEQAVAMAFAQSTPASSDNDCEPSVTAKQSIQDDGHKNSCIERRTSTTMDFPHNEPSLIAKQSIQSIGGAGDEEQATQNWATLHKYNKRKPSGSGNGSSPNSANSKEVKRGRSKKQKKCNNEAVKEEEEEEEEEDQEGNKIKDHNNGPPAQEPPKGYIHVRARRGEATDSHSLAERVRREKISERMRLLQALVPGCDKVTGKATVLDEIINYVQSLQSQVEFLSMKLTSLSPMIYNVDVDLEPLLLGQQGFNMMIPPLPSTQQGSPGTTIAPPTSLSTATATTSLARTPLIEAPGLFNPQQQLGQRWTNPPCLQGNIGSLYWEVGDRGGPGLTTESAFCNNDINNSFYRRSLQAL